MKLDELVALKERAESLPRTQQDRTIARMIAELLKVRRLVHEPGMDRIAIALNKEPNDSEVNEVSEILSYAKALGFGLSTENVE
jgi:hypothetical protein